MKTALTALALGVAAALAGCASSAPLVTPAPPAPVVYRLNVCTDPAHTAAGCDIVSEHASSGECEAAKKAYLSAHPSHSAGCLKKP